MPDPPQNLRNRRHLPLVMPCLLAVLLVSILLATGATLLLADSIEETMEEVGVAIIDTAAENVELVAILAAMFLTAVWAWVSLQCFLEWRRGRSEQVRSQ